MPTRDDEPDAGAPEQADRPGGADRAGEDALTTGRQQSRWTRAARRYGPFIAVAVVALGAVAVFGDGDGDDRATDADAVVTTDADELVRAGPMTPQKADLLGEAFEPGPTCDPETERIMLPTVYAPPCVETFEGDNGGATSPGVAEDTIRLVLYVPREDFFLSMLADQDVDFDPALTVQGLQDYVALYNEVFEGYGRQVELEVYRGRGDADDDAQAQADAIAIAEKEPFAVIGGPFAASQAFADELAARGVVCLPGCAASGLPDDLVEESSPYVWPDGMPSAQSGGIAGEAIAALARPDQPAELAGDPDLHDRERVYGVLYVEGDGEEMYAALRDSLAEHGVEIELPIEYSLDASRVQEEARNQVVQLKEAGVTTVIVTGAPFTPGFLTNQATEQDYFPEWILGPSYFADTRVFAQETDEENQWVNGFGIGYKLTAADSAGQASGVYEWAYGREPDIPTAMPYIEPATRMLFTGIHLAGPELTASTFRDGLFRYPPSGDGVTSAVMSWGDHGIWPEVDYGSEDDVAVLWWDPEAGDHPEAFGGDGAVGFYRLAAGGQRYTIGELPGSIDGAGLFDDDSSVLMYGAALPREAEELFSRYPPPEGRGFPEDRSQE